MLTPDITRRGHPVTIALSAGSFLNNCPAAGFATCHSLSVRLFLVTPTSLVGVDDWPVRCRRFYGSVFRGLLG